MVYHYSEAVQQQKKLESETQYVARALEELEGLLVKEAGECGLGMQIRQQFLREQKVLELLVLVVKVIDILSHSNKPSTNVTGTKDKSKLIKIVNR